MKRSSLNTFLDFWKTVYSAKDPIAEFVKYNGPLPDGLDDKIDMDVYPEPYWGDFQSLEKSDVLVLLINPGRVHGERAERNALNTFTRQRFQENWDRETFVRYHGTKPSPAAVNLPGWKFQKTKIIQIRKVFDCEINILHSIELFPFHSASWTANKKQRQEIINLKSTQLTVDAIKEIAKEHRVKAIIAISKKWVEVLEELGCRRLQAPLPFIGKNGGRAHEFFKYELENGALPIMIYSGPSMNLPSEECAVKALQSMMK